MQVEIMHARQWITHAYSVLTHNKNYTDIQKYMLKAEVLHEGFWPLHKKLCSMKGDLRNALNIFSETSERVFVVIAEINKIIDIDKKNKLAKKRELTLIQKEKAIDLLRKIEEEESDELSPLKPNDEIYD